MPSLHPITTQKLVTTSLLTATGISVYQLYRRSPPPSPPPSSPMGRKQKQIYPAAGNGIYKPGFCSNPPSSGPDGGRRRNHRERSAMGMGSVENEFKDSELEEAGTEVPFRKQGGFPDLFTLFGGIGVGWKEKVREWNEVAVRRLGVGGDVGGGGVKRTAITAEAELAPGGGLNAGECKEDGKEKETVEHLE